MAKPSEGDDQWKSVPEPPKSASALKIIALVGPFWLIIVPIALAISVVCVYVFGFVVFWSSAHQTVRCR